MTRPRFLAAVRGRIEVLVMGREIIGQKITQLQSLKTIPPHVVSELGLEIALVDAQLEWLQGLVVDVENGGLDFVGDPEHGTRWAPPADDPAGRWPRSATGTRHGSPGSAAPELLPLDLTPIIQT